MKPALRLAPTLCILFAIAPAQAAPAEPPGQIAVPGDQKTFSEGVAAFDAGDYAQAFAIFKTLSENDDIAALRNVALMQRKGLGTAKDPAAALRNYETAARAGLPTAAADLGEMLLDGEAGAPDPQRALPWLRMAANAGHTLAQFHLGEMYERGEGVPQDYAKAELLYAAAAAHGEKRALDRLSYLKGMPQPEFGGAGAAPPQN